MNAGHVAAKCRSRGCWMDAVDMEGVIIHTSMTRAALLLQAQMIRHQVDNGRWE